MTNEDYIKKFYKGNPDDLTIRQKNVNYIVKKGSKEVVVKRIDIDDKNERNIKNELALLD